MQPGDEQVIADMVDAAFREQLSPWRRIGEIAAGVLIALLVTLLIVGCGAALYLTWTP